MLISLKNAATFFLFLFIILNDSCGRRKTEQQKSVKEYPLAITMRDFSWLERRRPGAGYQCRDNVPSESLVRGYSCDRIVASPQLVAVDPKKGWMLDPHWGNQDWDSSAINILQVQRNLNEFIGKYRNRDIRVALSTWWRGDTARTDKIKSLQDLADMWLATLQSIKGGGVLDNIEYVYLCNEFPYSAWTPSLSNNLEFESEQCKKWLNKSVRLLKQHLPNLKYIFSFAGGNNHWNEFDLLREPDIIEFIAKIPTVLEETRTLETEFGKFIVQARRTAETGTLPA